MSDAPRGLLDDFEDAAAAWWEWRDDDHKIKADRSPRRADESFADYLMRANPEARKIAEGFAGGPLGGAAGVVKQVGRGVFGSQLAASSWKEALEALKALQKKEPGKGEIVAHLSNPAVGDIGAPWGVAGTGASDGWGIAKLLEFHPEVLDDLPSIISRLRPTKSSPNRMVLKDPTHTAVIRRNWDDADKNWLLTAFENLKSAPPRPKD